MLEEICTYFYHKCSISHTPSEKGKGHSTALRKQLPITAVKILSLGYNYCSKFTVWFQRHHCISVAQPKASDSDRWEECYLLLFTLTRMLWCFEIWCLLSACLESKSFINTDLTGENVGAWQSQENAVTDSILFQT